MNPVEALTLCRLAKGMCPQQSMDEYTPDAWHMLLEDLRFEDCKAALANLGRRSPFVAPAEIRAEVKRLRADRIAKFGPFDPPREIADGTAREYGRWLGEMNRRIADGELTPENYRPELGSRPMPAVEGVFRAVDDPWAPDPGAPEPCTVPGCDGWCDNHDDPRKTTEGETP